MSIQRGFRALIAVTIASLVMASVALADSVSGDADLDALASPHANALTANQQPGTTVAYPLSAIINNTGNSTNDVFKVAGDKVTVTITRGGAWLDGSSAPASFEFTAYNASQSGSLAVTVPCDTAAGTSQTMSAALSASATNGQSMNPNSVNLSFTITAQGSNGSSCTPPNTPPTVSVTGVTDGATYEFGAVPAAGCSVVDAEDTGESAVPQVGAIIGPLAAYGLGSQTVTCSYTDGGGLSDSDTATYTIQDTGAPTITDAGPTAAATGANGWYIVAVTNKFTASDSGAGFLSPLTNPHDFTKSSGTAEGSAVKINSGTVTDVAGNVATAIDSAAFKIDLTDPVNAVTGVAHGATYILGSVPAADCSTTDPGGDPSGVASSATVSVTGGTSNGVGTFTATCSGGSDNAGRLAANATATYQVHFGGLSGILQPINSDNTSVFNRGKSVPVKFRLAGDEPTGFDFSGWTLKNQQVSCTNFDAIDAELEPVVENPSNAFRYDATADQYIYNANFKDKAVGTCWKVVVTLDSGQTMTSAIFRLQK